MTPLLGRWKAPHSATVKLTDDDVRAMRWWASSPDAEGMSLQRQATILGMRYGVSPCTAREVLQRHTHVGIEGPPLSARYWKGREADGLIAWLVWLVFVLSWPRT